MIHYTKKFKPRRSSEIVAKGVGFENPPKKSLFCFSNKINFIKQTENFIPQTAQDETSTNELAAKIADYQPLNSRISFFSVVTAISPRFPY